MIKNAIVVGSDILPERYNAEKAERGTKEFAVRAHVLAEVLRNAQRWVKGYQSLSTKAKKFGDLVDCLLLTPKQWPQRYTVLPSDAPRRPSQRQIDAKKPSPESVAAIQWWAQFTKANPGETISNDWSAAVHAAIERLRADAMITDLIDSSQHQMMIVADWEDNATGLTVPCKCLIDIVPNSEHPVFSNSLWDLKTTANAAPRSFSRDAQKYSYHLQAAWYLDMFNAATGEQRSDFGHVVLENYAPYEFRTPPPLLTQRFIAFGRLCYQRALEIYCRGVATGVWPGYDRPGSWPLTDCDDWFLDMATIYSEIDEEDEENETPTEEVEVTP